jgi:hypothetical protein
MEAHERLKILLFTEGSTWIAQCLQIDITAQGDSHTNALERLSVLFWAQHYLDKQAGRLPFSAAPKAPKRYWEMFNKGNKITIHLNLPPIPTDDMIQEADVKLATAA